MRFFAHVDVVVAHVLARTSIRSINAARLAKVAHKALPATKYKYAMSSVEQ
jgi:hypothetical protein